jgi:hypothetical protein
MQYSRELIGRRCLRYGALLAGLKILDSAYLAELGAAGLPITEITFNYLLRLDVERHGAKRTGGNAHPAADTDIIIYSNPVQGCFP